MARWYLIPLLCWLVPALTSASEQPAISAEDKEMLYETAEGFADCAGAYEAMSMTMKARGHENVAISVHEFANGAQIAGAWLLYSMGAIKDWQEALTFIKERAGSETTRWAGLFEVSTTDQYLAETVNTLIESYGHRR